LLVEMAIDALVQVLPLKNSFITDSRVVPAANMILLSYTNVLKDHKSKIFQVRVVHIVSMADKCS